MVIMEWLFGRPVPLQRQPQPMDRWTPRHALAEVGQRRMRPATLRAGTANQKAWESCPPNDGLIRSDRQPVYHQEYRVSGHRTGFVDWTACGPVRRELHMHNFRLRLMDGNSQSRAFQHPDDWQKGLHTMTQIPKVAAIKRYQQSAQISPPRLYRLAPTQYEGQSYSQRTRPQGGG